MCAMGDRARHGFPLVAWSVLVILSSSVAALDLRLPAEPVKTSPSASSAPLPAVVALTGRVDDCCCEAETVRALDALLCVVLEAGCQEPFGHAPCLVTYGGAQVDRYNQGQLYEVLSKLTHTAYFSYFKARRLGKCPCLF